MAKCPMRGGTEFDGPRPLILARHANYYLLKGWIAWRGRRLRVQARVCLNCGHLDQVVDLPELRAKLARVKPDQ